MSKVHHGLEGIVVTQTRLSMVDGQAGELVIAGFPLEELAPNATFEETAWLLWNGELPDERTRRGFQEQLAAARTLPPHISRLLAEAAPAGIDGMDALRMAVGTLTTDDAAALLAALPTIVAAWYRLSRKKDPIAPNPSLGHAANYLYMLTGEEPHPERVRALDTYLNTVVDHGLNASTFTARVITSTGSDLVSAVTGAIGALKGPLHGGAPGPALDMVFEIGDPSRAEEVLRKKLQSGERLMGFGHRVYKVRDPRADVLAAAAEKLFQRGGDIKLYQLARSVEETALRLLEEFKPGRKLQTNVEFYTALVLHGIGMETSLFTPTFAVSRAAGWIAHCFEQRREGRLIRPQSIYIGERGRRWSR